MARKTSRKLNGIAGCRTIDEYVDQKLNKLFSSDKSFEALFELMFSEEENILFEKSTGFRIVRTTYGQAKNKAVQYASAIKKAFPDLVHNDIVGLDLENSIEWIELFWAILISGCRPLLINSRIEKNALCDVLSSCDVKAVISDRDIYTQKTVSPKDLSADGETAVCGAFGTEIFFLTSGTSNQIKACAYTAEALCWQISDSSKIIKECRKMKTGYDGNIRQLCFLPFYHIFGLVAVYFWFTFFGRTLVQLNDLRPETILRTINRHEVTHIFAVPLFWNSVYKQAIETINKRGENTRAKFQKGMKIAKAVQDVPVLGNLLSRLMFAEVRENLFGESICFMISGGSKIESDVVRFFNSIGYHLVDGYGASEIGITSVELGTKKSLINSLSTGKPLSSVEYRINEKGELLVKGKTIAHYIIKDGQTEESGEWFNTHDMARLEKGRMFVEGRSDELVVADSGENLNPYLVESLFDFEELSDVCLIQSGSDAVLLASLLRPLSSEQLTVLKAKLSSRISESSLSGLIAKLVITDKKLLAENDFKLSHKRIAAAYEKGYFTEYEASEPVVSEPSDDDIAERLKRLMIKALPGKKTEDISVDDDFFLDLGGNSLDYFSFMTDVSEEFGIDLLGTGETKLTSIRLIKDYLSSK